METISRMEPAINIPKLFFFSIIICTFLNCSLFSFYEAALCYIGFAFFKIDIPVGPGKTAFHFALARMVTPVTYFAE